MTGMQLVDEGPTAPRGLSTALPRSASLTDALLAPCGHPLAADAVRALRDDLARTLCAVVAELPAGERLRIDAFTARVARHHPERCSAGADPFVPSPATCRRAIGVAAVARCVRGLSCAPASGVFDVLAAAAEDVAVGMEGGARPPWWSPWYAQLPAGGRAVVSAEAVTWATHLYTALDWGRFERRPVVGAGDDWWDCPGSRQLTLKGRADVRVLVGASPAYVVVGNGSCPPDWQAELGLPALVGALARGGASAPCRVVGVWPTSGQVRLLDVDADVLEAAATSVISAVGTWVDGRLEVCGARQAS